VNDNAAWARFFQSLAAASTTLAEDLLVGTPSAPPTAAADVLPDVTAEHNLGSLQLLVVKTPGVNSEEGLKTAEISRWNGRADSANIDTALNALAKRRIMEKVPGKAPSHWRLVARYRHG
jgi:hypothetical protein